MILSFELRMVKLKILRLIVKQMKKKKNPIVQWQKLQGHGGKCTFRGGLCKIQNLGISVFNLFPPHRFQGCLPPSPPPPLSVHLQMHRRSRAKLSPVYSLRPGTTAFRMPFQGPCSSESALLEVPTT